MKKSVHPMKHIMTGITLVLLLVSVIPFSRVSAQETHSVTGKLVDQKKNQAVPYAVISLYKEADKHMINGSVSDTNGVFEIGSVPPGNYRLMVSLMGYKPVSRMLSVDQNPVDAGIIHMEDTVILMKESVVYGERLKAKSERDKTIYFITKKMLDASITGMDLLTLIPGIQVDIMQNISLEGSKDILIFVDGMQRDRSFVSQLNPSLVDKVEIISTPSSNYDANVTGVINIILKKERDAGISGQICFEAPTSKAEIYLSPTYSLNYGFKKWNFYTSYNGDLSYFDIHESTSRQISGNSGVNEIISNQWVRQKDWSHKFHYGIDYFISARDQVNFYVFYNPYSREFDGTANAMMNDNINNSWNAGKEDTDKNTGTFYSLYYKHNFVKKGREITFDLSNYHLRSENNSVYTGEGNKQQLTLLSNYSNPRLNITSFKADYTTPIGGKLKLGTGIKMKYQEMTDNHSNDFNYKEKTFAAYGILSYKYKNIDMSTGLRIEKSEAALENIFNKPLLSFLPQAAIRYQLAPGQNIKVSYRSSVIRPAIYQLNPFISMDDPYTVRTGNPLLEPEFRNNFLVEHSLQFGSNYLSSGLFYTHSTRVINDLTIVNDTNAFITKPCNLGTLNQYGIQFSGSMRMGILTFNPILKIFGLQSAGNDLAQQYAISNRQQLAFESSFSAVLSLRHELAFSVIFQYASPKNNIQDNHFSDALYFFAAEKTIKNIKIGIKCGIPFSKSFTYQGSEIKGTNFYSHYEGNLKISSIPAGIKIVYQFHSGKNKERIQRAKEEIDNVQKKGF